MLTPDPARRAQRLLAAARANREAGALDAVLGLLVAAEAGPLGGRQAAVVERLRGQIAFDQRRGSDAAPLLLSATRDLEPFDAGLAREAHLESLAAALYAGDLGRPGGIREAARAAPPGPDPRRAVDVVLDALALRLTEGHAAAAPTLTRTLKLLLALDVSVDKTSRWLRFSGGGAGTIIALELWDFESWHALAARRVQVARDTGALVQLQFTRNSLAGVQLLVGMLSAAERLIDEDA